MKNNTQVEHPDYYNKHPSGVECIEVVRHFSFNIGNVVKYVWRAGLKDDNETLQDLKKALFYLQDEINRLEGKYDRTRLHKEDMPRKRRSFWQSIYARYVS